MNALDYVEKLVNELAGAMMFNMATGEYFNERDKSAARSMLKKASQANARIAMVNEEKDVRNEHKNYIFVVLAVGAGVSLGVALVEGYGRKTSYSPSSSFLTTLGDGLAHDYPIFVSVASVSSSASHLIDREIISSLIESGFDGIDLGGRVLESIFPASERKKAGLMFMIDRALDNGNKHEFDKYSKELASLT